MAGDDKPGGAGEEEPNLYKKTLESCRDTLIPNATDAVYDGAGDPGKPIADAINGGGWECTEADSWVTELLSHTSKVLPAFDDARSTVSAKIASEPEKVPKGDPHGLAWSRNWAIQRRNI
jgi:hypothetical protein